VEGLTGRLQAQLDRVNEQQLALRWVSWVSWGGGSHADAALTCCGKYVWSKGLRLENMCGARG
jgi:hypothetical protein